MTLYISRETSKLWTRLWAEVTTEINLLAENWKYLLAGLVFQELGSERSYISETLFSFLFLLFFLWTFHPFIFKSKMIYTVLIWCRVLAFLCGSERVTLPRPDNIIQAFIIIPRGIIYGCGDLIVSSHMIFTLVFVRTHNKYGTKRFIKICSWLIAVAQSLLFIASRKHYTVDVVVAWYTVNLVVFFVDKKLPDIPDRTSDPAIRLLPSSTKEKDARNKDENHKLINGNSGDPIDRRQRTQMNGKVLDDSNEVPTRAGTTMNGVLRYY